MTHTSSLNLYLHCIVLRSCLTLSLHPSGKMLQDAERRFRGVLSCEEMGQAGYLGPYQESIVSMTQNCVLVSNIRLQTCVFLSKGMATCRQAVRKSAQTSYLLPYLSVFTSALYLTWKVFLSLPNKLPQQLSLLGCSIIFYHNILLFPLLLLLTGILPTVRREHTGLENYLDWKLTNDNRRV